MVHHAQAFPTGIRSSTHQIWWYILWSAKSEVCQEEEQFHGLIDIEQNEYSTPHIRAQKMFVCRKHVCNSNTRYQQSIKDVDNPTIQRELANIKKKWYLIQYMLYCWYGHHQKL
jgi:hypothetical protein